MLDNSPNTPGPSTVLSKSSLASFPNSQQSQENPFEASALIEEIDAELQKDQQGVSEEDVLNKILSKLERSIINESSGRACKSDGIAFKKFSQLMVSKASNLKDGKENCVNVGMLARCLKDLSRNDDDDDEDDIININSSNAFVNIGKRLSFLLCKAPNYNCLKPCIPFAENLQGKAKKERGVRSQRPVVADTQVIVGKTTQEAKEETQNENSVTKELDLVRRHLRSAWKNARCDSIDYYRFILHPTNFGESVENMFYVSFLVKDGYIRLKVDPSNGMPSIVKLTREEKEALSSMNRSAVNTTQFVTKLDYSIWKRLVNCLEIRKPLIVR